MILADKIILHRKRLNLTQEELADKLGVSRQSVSKWEGAQSIPDMNKIIQLGNVFGVSIDYLMRDDFKDPEYVSDEYGSEIKKINLEFANRFIDESIQYSKMIGFGVFIIILSPAILILLNELKANNLIALDENRVSALGLMILFLLVATAVGIFIAKNMSMTEYEFLNNEVFEVEYGVEGAVKMREEAFKSQRIKENVMGVVFIILSVIPIFLSEILLEIPLLSAMSVPLLLSFVAIGVYLLVSTGIHSSAYKKLLQEDGYTPKEKKNAHIYGKLSGIYWLSATAIYLGLSFTSNAWDRTWIIWPVAGVSFGVIAIIVSIFLKDD